MSDPTPVEGQEPESLVLDPGSATAFEDILGFLAPDESAPAAAAGAEEGAAAPEEPGQQPAPAEGAATAGADTATPAAGADGQQAVAPAAGDGAAPAAAGDTGNAGAAPDARGVVDATSLADSWANVSTSFEQNQAQLFEAEALDSVRKEHSDYFDAISKHPRLLIGAEVPRADGQPGKETLRDAQDAKDWQDAIKHQLVQIVKSRAQEAQDQLKPVFETVHASIGLFRDNVDLVPGTKQFDKELAEQFVALAKDYELRSGEKLIGWSVPVQPMINQLRSQLAAKRAAAPAAPAAPTAQQQRAAEQPRTAAGQFDGPQAGISSKAGQSSAGGDSEAGGIMAAFLRNNGVQI